MQKSSIVALLMIIVAIGLILSVSNDVTSYSNFSEAEMMQKRVKVVGQLAKTKEMIYNPSVDENYFSFYMTDAEGRTEKVLWNHAKPTDFERSERIVATGILKDGVFNADHVLLKCPSKYKNEELAIRTK